MSSRHRSQSDRIRRLWPQFKQSVAKSRSLIQHKVGALQDKAQKDYEKTPLDKRPPIDAHNAHKANLAKNILEPHFKSLRTQWEQKLLEVGLKMEDWMDMSNDEMASVLEVLGNPEDEHNDSPKRPSPTPPTHFPTAPIAPSISASTRSTNVSTTSSYAFVDPREFHSEEEDNFFFPVASPYDLTSDDEEKPVPSHQNGFDAWSSDSSFSAPSSSRFPTSSLPSNPRKMTSAGKQAASLKVKEENSAPKIKQSYTGSIVNDPDEPLSEAEDFERFKMSTRFQKIIEFHQTAAQFEIELALAIYKDRLAQIDTTEISSKVTNHQRRMAQLQMEKEEERRSIVKAERSRRREELRKRPGRSGTLMAPRPSAPANPVWLTAFQEQVFTDVEENIVLEKVLNGDHEEQERLLQQLFPGSSNGAEGGYSHFSQQGEYTSTGHNNWGLPSTTTDNNDSTPVRRVPNERPNKLLNKPRFPKPSLFGEDDPDSSGEEAEEDESPSPPDSTNAPPHQHDTNPFMNADADSALTQHMMADPEIYAYLNQWGNTNQPPTATIAPPTAIPSASPWALAMGSKTQQPPQPHQPNQVLTPTMGSSDPWAMMSKSAPIATRRKVSFSASGPIGTPTQNSFGAFLSDQGQSPPGAVPNMMSLGMLAAYNSVNGNADGNPNLMGEKQTWVGGGSSKEAIPLQIPTLTASTSVSPSTPAIPSKSDTSSGTGNGKKSNKKQRQALKKSGVPLGNNIGGGGEDSPQSPQGEKTPMATVFDQIPQPVQGKLDPNPNFTVTGSGRGRKDSVGGWGELLSTPRPSSNIPSHLVRQTQAQGGFGEDVQRSVLSSSGMSTIKAPAQKGFGLKGRSAWSIFGLGSDTGTANGETESSMTRMESSDSGGARDPWIPGAFEADDGDGGGGFGGGVNLEGPAIWSPKSAWSVPNVNTTSNLNETPISNVKSPMAKNVSGPQSPPQPPSTTNKKGKGKKGKGKKVTVEEVDDDDQDSHGDKLPVDHRYVMESKTPAPVTPAPAPVGSRIMEPRPSVPPRMYDSIIGFGSEEGEEGGMMGGQTGMYGRGIGPGPGMTSTSEFDLFNGDVGRLNAAMQEIQQASKRMENKNTVPPVWGMSDVGGKPKSVQEQKEGPGFGWGLLNGVGGIAGGTNAEEKKGTNSNSTTTSTPASSKHPLVPNVKRGRAASSVGKVH